VKTPESEPQHRDRLALAGLDPVLLGLGLLAVRADWPLVGLAGADHSRALEATIVLGCPAFPDLREPTRAARMILLEGPDRSVLDQVRPVLRPGTVLGHLGPEGPEALAGVELPLALHLVGGLPPPGAASLLGGIVALEGPEEATRRAADLVRALGGTPRLLGRLDCLRALAAVELTRRHSRRKAWSLWPGPTAGLPCEPPEVAALQGTAFWPWGGSGRGPCEAPRTVLVRLLRELDPQAARVLEEEETEP